MRGRVGWLVYLLVWCGITWASSAFGGPIAWVWWDNAAGNTGDRAAQIAEVGPSATHTMSVQYWEPADWTAAREAGLRVVLMLPHEVVLAVSDRDPHQPARTLPMWCRTGWCNKTLQDWIALVEAHRDQVAIVLIDDERDCNTDDGVRFPNWTVASCQRAAAKLRVLHESVKAWLPWVKTWTNYTAAWAYYFVLAQQRGQQPSVFGASLAPTDLLSFDCYQPFETCFGRTRVDTLYQSWHAHMTSSQRLALVPRAFGGSYLGWNPTDPVVIATAQQYEAYAARDADVELIAPFLYRDVETMIGARTRPLLRAAFAAWGARVRGQSIIGTPPGPPQGLRIVR